MQYFVHETRVHMYPVPRSCNVHYSGETLHNDIPHGYEKCDNCFRLPK